MTEIRKLWQREFPPIPESELLRLRRSTDDFLWETAACFWLFRVLHCSKSPAAVLMGDYCFGRFSHHLAAIDNVELTNAFGAYLRRDALVQPDFDDYLEFVKGL